MRRTIFWILAAVVLLAYPKAADASAVLGVSTEKVIVFKDGETKEVSCEYFCYAR